MLLGKKKKGDTLSWETGGNFTEEVNPGSDMLALKFYRLHPHHFHELVYYVPFLMILPA